MTAQMFQKHGHRDTETRRIKNAVRFHAPVALSPVVTTSPISSRLYQLWAFLPLATSTTEKGRVHGAGSAGLVAFLCTTNPKKLLFLARI